LGEKLTVAVGGSFSAGKSSLINALLGQKLLVVEIDPTTSLPTYLLHGAENSISALNLFGNRIALSEEEFNSLTHDETQLYGSNINRLLKSAFITSPDFAWNNLAIIDMPGYTKHEDAQHSERTDETIALAQLQAAQAIIWVINAAQGCITEDDVQFLSQLDANTPKLIVLTRADQKASGDMPAIISGIKSTLTKREIVYLDVIPVSARKPQAWPLDAVQTHLAQWNEQTRPLRFAYTLQSQFSRYTQHLEQQVAQARQQLQWCNKILSLANQAEITAPATDLKARAQQALASAQQQQTALTDIQSRFFLALQSVGDEMGMSMRVSEVPDQKQELAEKEHNGTLAVLEQKQVLVEKEHNGALIAMEQKRLMTEMQAADIQKALELKERERQWDLEYKERERQIESDHRERERQNEIRHKELMRDAEALVSRAKENEELIKRWLCHY
jgi:GTP-binding protein EngB required for normal cell division